VDLGQEDPRENKLNDMTPINVTVTNSGKIALPELIKQMLLFTLAASRFNSKVCLFSLFFLYVAYFYWHRTFQKYIKKWGNKI